MEAKISTYVRELLPNVDLLTTTERDIRGMVAKELGVDVNPYKSAIKKVLTEFIEAKSASNEQEEATGAPAETPAKRRRVLPPGSSQVDEVILGEEPEKIARKATVGSWKGRKNLDIREYYWDKKSDTPDWKPTKKGIALQPGQWDTLVANMDAISNALSAEDVTFEVSLNNDGSRKATITTYGSKGATVSVREFYRKGAEMAPGKKGINLTPEQWSVLCANAAGLTAALRSGGGAASPTNAKKDTKAARDAGASGAAKGGEWYAEIGGERRVTVSEFKGRLLCQIREYYKPADGDEMRPGVKGIALNSEQFASLADAANDISRAADDKDTSFDVNLGANKKATVREFKGSLYVDIREHYSKGDKLLPGKKGIMLPVGQWRVLEEHLPEVVKRMGV